MDEWINMHSTLPPHPTPPSYRVLVLIKPENIITNSKLKRLVLRENKSTWRDILHITWRQITLVNLEPEWNWLRKENQKDLQETGKNSKKPQGNSSNTKTRDTPDLAGAILDRKKDILQIAKNTAKKEMKKTTLWGRAKMIRSCPCCRLKRDDGDGDDKALSKRLLKLWQHSFDWRHLSSPNRRGFHVIATSDVIVRPVLFSGVACMTYAALSV